MKIFHLLFILILPISFAMGQACRIPLKLDQIKPEKCGIRYLEKDAGVIKVILEFEKKARVITPENPSDVKGQSVNLIGLLYVTYNMDGDIMKEKHVFVQTGDIPEQGMVFGLNGQRGTMIESDMELISLEYYATVPIGGMLKDRMPKDLKNMEGRELFAQFGTNLITDKQGRIIKLLVNSLLENDSLVIDRSIDLMNFDSSTKKTYWANIYPAVYDPAGGNTLALLNRFDRNVSSDLSHRLLRLVALDTAGVVIGQHTLEFPEEMNLVHREEIMIGDERGFNALSREILVFAKVSQLEEGVIDQYFYYEFNVNAELQNSMVILSKYDIFNTMVKREVSEGRLLISNAGHELVSCFIGSDGTYNISSSDKRIKVAHDLSQRSVGGAVSLELEGEPTALEDGSYLLIVGIREYVGVPAGGALASTSTQADHGFAIVKIEKDGEIGRLEYYQRPKNADPRAIMEFSAILRNDNNIYSFYATESTSVGIFPVFCMVDGNHLKILSNEEGLSMANYFYHDPQEAIVGYFGLKKDPQDPRKAIRTIEILSPR